MQYDSNHIALSFPLPCIADSLAVTFFSTAVALHIARPGSCMQELQSIFLMAAAMTESNLLTSPLHAGDMNDVSSTLD